MSNISERAFYAPTLVTSSKTIEIHPMQFGTQWFQIFERYSPFAFESAWPNTEDHDAEVWDFLESVEDGWDDGKGIAPSKEGLRWLKSSPLALLLRFHRDSDFPWKFPMGGPAVFPMASGEVEFQWDEENLLASLKIDVDTQKGTLYLRNRAAVESSLIDYDFSSANNVLKMMINLYDFFKLD